MNKIIAALVAGLFAVSVSVGAFAADAAKPSDNAAQAADASKEKPAAPAPKKAHKKTEKMGPHETTSSEDFGRVAPAHKMAHKTAHKMAHKAAPKKAHKAAPKKDDMKKDDSTK